MSDRVASDNPSVETLRATLARSGGTRRLVVHLPEADPFPVGDVVRLVIDGRTTHAPIDRRSDGTPVVRGAFDNRRLARSPGEGADRLAEWARERDLDAGRSVLVDVVVSDDEYGLRVPGETAVYEPAEPPDASLRRIADGLDEG